MLINFITTYSFKTQVTLQNIYYNPISVVKSLEKQPRYNQPSHSITLCSLNNQDNSMISQPTSDS